MGAIMSLWREDLTDVLDRCRSEGAGNITDVGMQEMMTEEERSHSQQWQRSLWPMVGWALSLLSTWSLSTFTFSSIHPQCHKACSHPCLWKNHEFALAWYKDNAHIQKSILKTCLLTQKVLHMISFFFFFIDRSLTNMKVLSKQSCIYIEREMKNKKVKRRHKENCHFRSLFSFPWKIKRKESTKK